MSDYFGLDATRLKNKKLFLFDMDGTIYKEDSLFEGTLDLMSAIKIKGGHYVFITNNSSKSVIDYVKKLNKMRIEATEDNFFTSSQATAILLRQKYSKAKVYCQGTESLLKELKNFGINVTDKIEDDIGLILVGFDTELTSEKLKKTCFLLTKNIPYYATNCDLRCPVSFGYIPDCGSICEMLENCTGRKPIYIGKPEPTMVLLAMQKYCVTNEETVVVGDRLYTDIATGLNAGVDTICVLTGEATLQKIRKSTIEPTFVFDSVKEILSELT